MSCTFGLTSDFAPFARSWPGAPTPLAIFVAWNTRKLAAIGYTEQTKSCSGVRALDPSSSIPPTSEDGHLKVRKARLVQIFWAVEITMVASALQRLLLADDLHAALVILAVAAASTSVLYCVRRDRLELSSSILLTLLTAMTSYFIWMYDGLRDEALLGYPAILILSAVLVSPRLFWALLVFMIVNLMTLGYMSGTGQFVQPSGQADMSTAIQSSLILAVTVYCVWLLNRDIQQLLLKLHNEIQRVHQSRQEIQHLVFHDPLTDLPNRLLAEERLRMALAQSERDSQMTAVLFIDLDNFKAINDSLGHQAGDAYLKHVTTLLKGAVRRSDTVCRLSGDEFLIILGGIDRRDEASIVAEKLLRGIETPMHLSNRDVTAGASVGIALAPVDGDDFDTLTRKADIAMYHSKNMGRNRFHFYASHMSRETEGTGHPAGG